MKVKNSDKWVITNDLIYEGKNFLKGQIYMIGELMFRESGKTAIEEYGLDSELDMPDDMLEEIYKLAKPLALVREERIDEILS